MIGQAIIRILHSDMKNFILQASLLAMPLHAVSKLISCYFKNLERIKFQMRDLRLASTLWWVSEL